MSDYNTNYGIPPAAFAGPDYELQPPIVSRREVREQFMPERGESQVALLQLPAPILAPAVGSVLGPLPWHQIGQPLSVSKDRASFGNPDINNRGHMLGASTLVVGVAALTGARFGGVYGGMAGSLLGGAAINAYRGISFAADGSPASDREALISATYALLSAGLAGYILYRYSSSKKPVAAAYAKNTDSPSCGQSTKNGRRSCGIRPII